MHPLLIEIEQDRPGFNGFIGSWLYRGDNTIIVDVGPSNSVNHLIESLTAMDVDRIDFVLLTHIHIDHAGGLAELLDHFPMARAICHNKGIKHLVDPSRLWSGSLNALGEVAESYGPMSPVEPERLIPHTDADLKDLKIIETPGHAPHHLSFLYQGHFFVGEAGGNYFTIPGKDYLRPATPPIFSPAEFLTSVDALIALEDQPMYYGHFGSVESSREFLQRFRDQLLRWREIIEEEMSTEKSDLVERCVERLLEKDQDLKNFPLLEPDIQEREQFFLSNSVRGYVGFLKDNR
jgi:glyoxylase-like metal-dependent hydrolase (beta-lactamase superfamily II)